MIEETVRELAQARAWLEADKEYKRRLVEVFEQSKEYQIALADIERNAAHVERLENTLRAEALGQYANDNNKSGTGYKVKNVTRVELADESRLKPWLLTNFTPALKIDTKAVEKAAKAGSLPPELATVSEEPQVYIDADLSQFLKE